MHIIKNGKEYVVSESQKKWTIGAEGEKLSVTFEVSKDICKTYENLQKYVLQNNLF